ncbi:hypothetical protein SUGI_1146980 [Cryptomeria japonica]|nr:hypothetical protein SUGI_1146980 [Cryptomeria japonica]
MDSGELREANFKMIQSALENEGIEEMERDIPLGVENPVIMEKEDGEEECSGLCPCCPQRGKLDCGKISGKRRGRKTLAEIRLKDGFVVDQTKITTMLNAGKGKNLPKES